MAQWEKMLKDGTTLKGVCGGVTHAHEVAPGIGHIRVQGTNAKIPYNNFTNAVNDMLPPILRQP